MLTRFLIILFFLVQAVLVAGQGKYTMIFHPELQGVDYPKISTDSVNLNSNLNKYLLRLYQHGYLLASIDSSIVKDHHVNVYTTPGKQFDWLKLRPGNAKELLLRKSGYRERFYQDKPFDLKKLGILMEGILVYSENHGFPFANVKLDSIEINGNKIQASLNYESGPNIEFDSLEIQGDIKIKKIFLERYLGIRPGESFDQSVIDHLPGIIKKVSYLDMARPPLIEFRENKARVILFLKPQKVNYFDGIVGILPNEGNNSKVLFTGQANLILQNFFGTGKKLKVEWQRFNNASQLLDLNYFHPVFLGSQLNIDAHFNLLKQDSAFLLIDRGLGISQKIKSTGNIGLFANVRSSRTLGETDINEKDFNLYQYGLKLDLDNLDDIFYPRRGWIMAASISLGNKSLKNLDPETDQEILKNSVQLQSGVELGRFSPIGNFSTLLARMQSGMIYNAIGQYFQADLYRIGGLQSLRGFNQNNFYARNFAVSTLEYRIFLEQSAYFLVFVDQAFIYNPFLADLEEDFPTGFGTGLSFTTGPGVFTFIYSLGRNNVQPVKFNLSKIHFGFISRF